MSSPRVAVVIPARLESTRLPRKLLLEVESRPIIAHTIMRALHAASLSDGLISRVLVAADSPELVTAAEAAGANAILTRVDHQSGTDRIAEAAANLTEEIIVNVQGDEPEIEYELILKAAKMLVNSDAPMGTLAYPISSKEVFENPNVVKVVSDEKKNALYFSRAQVPYPREGNPLEENIWGHGHIGIYAYRREFLSVYSKLASSKLERQEKLEQLRVLENDYAIKVEIVPPPAGRAIDTQADFDAFSSRQQNTK